MKLTLKPNTWLGWLIGKLDFEAITLVKWCYVASGCTLSPQSENHEASPVDFTVTDGVRTTEQQKALYAQGRTKPGAVVTNADGVALKSNHQVKADGCGYAVDLYPYCNGAVQVNDVAKLKQIAAHIKDTAQKLGYAVEWGGDWTSIKDYPHFELKA